MIFETPQNHSLIGMTIRPEASFGTWSPDVDAEASRRWRRALACAGLVATVAIVAALAALARPEAVYAQSAGGPTAKGTIPEQRLRVDGWTLTLDVREYFEASGALVLEASSLDETVATASATGETVTIVPVKKGITVIEVTAQNSDGSAVQRISVAVGPAVPPLAYTIETVEATRDRTINPQDVAVDGTGNLYVIESVYVIESAEQNHRISRVDAATGIITTIAGRGVDGYSGDGGPATEAQFHRPRALAVDGDGNVYIADEGNHRVRKVDAATGIIITLAGTGEPGYSGDGGPATEARFSFLSAMAVDGDGNVYIADAQNHRIRRVDAFTGIINTIAGTGEQCCAGSGPATEATLSFPGVVAVDAIGNVYITETGVTYIGGIGLDRVLVLKPLSGVTLRTPAATVDVSGYFAGFDAVRYEVESSDGVVETVRVMGSEVAIAALKAGEGVITVRAIGSDGRVATRTIPVTVDAAVLAYTISTLTGTSHVWDGVPATRAWLESPDAVEVDAVGNLYIVDRGHHRIRKVDAFTGTISTVAGTGEADYGGDGGPATEAMLSFPDDVAVDGAGNVYIVDGGNRVRKVDAATGIISTIAGMGRRGHGGDGGPATEARLNFPNGVTVDGAGNLYIADGGNNRIRKVDAVTGTISTIAGTGERGYTGDGGPATEAGLDSPSGVAVDGAGNFYIVDTWNNRIRKVDAVTGTISTIAGRGERGYSRDGGPATGARLNLPGGVAVSADCHLYVADTSNHRIRVLTPNPALASGGCAGGRASDPSAGR